MQRYESYKPSGVKWLGDVPAHWEVRPGFTCFKENKDRNKGLVENTVLSLSYGRIVIKPEEKLTGLVPESFESYQLIKPGDIVIRTTDLQNDQTSLRVGYAKDKGMITSAYLGLRCHSEISPEYMFRLLESYDELKVFYGMGSGLRQNIDFWDFKRLPVPLPPRDEQDRIVAFLEQKTAEIDAAIAKKERLIELLNEQQSIVTNHAVTRGLNPGAPVKGSGIGWLGEIPSHWMVKRVKHLARKIVDGAHHTPTYVDSGVPFLRVTDISGGKKAIDLASVKRIPEHEHRALCQRAFPQKGDVLLSKNGTIGETIVVDWDYEFSIFVSLCLIKLRGEIDPHFFCLYFSSPVVDLQLAEGGKRTSVTNLHLEKIKELVLALPPVEEQREIVRRIRIQLSPYDDLIEKTHRELVALNDFKKSLTASVVVGVVKV